MADAAGIGDPADALEVAALASVLAARLCHDLGGPLAGLAGALEVAREDAGMPEEALAIAVQGATELSGRLRLLRAAWAGGEAVEGAALAALAGALPGRVRVELDGLGDGVLPAPLARLALNLLLLGAESLPRGGTLRLERHGAGLRATLAGPKAAWPVLARAVAWRAVAPRDLQAPLTVLAAAEAGLRLAGDGPLVLLAAPVVGPDRVPE